MKRIDVTQDDTGLHAKYSAEEKPREKLSAKQKYTLGLFAIGGLLALGLVRMLGSISVLLFVIVVPVVALIACARYI